MNRDLKLENLLIPSPTAPMEAVKIADFGFAIDVSRFPSGILEGYVGSPAYMAPEIVLGKPYGNTQITSPVHKINCVEDFNASFLLFVCLFVCLFFSQASRWTCGH